MPKERFIAYPDAGRDTDPTPLLGWVGWDHAEQALVLGRIVTEQEAEGWADEWLVPMVAGLAELWRGWHSGTPSCTPSTASASRPTAARS